MDDDDTLPDPERDTIPMVRIARAPDPDVVVITYDETDGPAPLSVRVRSPAHR